MGRGKVWSSTTPLDQGSSATVDQVAAEIAGSPLDGYASRIVDDARSYGVPAEFFLGVAKGECDYGRVGSCAQSYNWTSISNAYYGGWPVPGTRWGQYPNAAAGIDAFFKLISGEYYGGGQTDLESIWWGIGGSSTVTGQHAYAPSFENSAASLDRVVATMNRVAGSNAPSGSGDASAMTPATGGLALLAAIVIAAVLFADDE